MLVLISPSKSITDKSPPFSVSSTDALFTDQTDDLIHDLQKHSASKLQKTLDVSKSLANLNYERFQNWTKTDTKSALWLYSGDVYNGLDAFTMNKSDVAFAQKHIGILSGLYGFVRPLDAIRPYRLEMKLHYSGPWGDSLYSAWSKTLADYIKHTGNETVLMCASKEYAKAATKDLSGSIRVVTPRFMQETEDGLKEKGLFAKYARGALARFVIDNRLTDINGIQNYTKDGFSYSKDLSKGDELVFIIPKDFSLKGRFTQKS